MTTPATESTLSTAPAPQSGMSFAGQVLQTLLNPGAAMAQVPGQTHRHYWLLALQLLISAAVLYWFFAGMSPGWLVEQQLMHAGELTPAETEQIRAAMAQMAGSTPIIGAVSAVVGSLLFCAVLAGYLLLTGKLQKALSYSQWFALTVWSQLPGTISLLGLVLLKLFAGTGDLPLTLANYASLNQLVLDLPVGHALFQWAEQLNLFLGWQCWILIAGLQTAAGFSRSRALLTVLTPLVAVFGIWALVA